MNLLERAKKLLNEYKDDKKEVLFFTKYDWFAYKESNPNYKEENKMFIVLDYEKK